MSYSSLRKKSDLLLVSKVKIGLLRQFLINLQAVSLGTKLAVLFSAIALAIIAQSYNFGRPWIFALSLIGLTRLVEIVSFLTENKNLHDWKTEYNETSRLLDTVIQEKNSLHHAHNEEMRILRHTTVENTLRIYNENEKLKSNLEYQRRELERRFNELSKHEALTEHESRILD
ncbi:hypothetical protein GIB67_008934 [Kingdonia uniflora]|uniref:Uncharacterized protein n=1 Tax=Kingdonia uniflora TaxID=39325 RepID=A0A7J7LVQ8_9MAGN|nr:hypothetical protein GIB67_008934 [Kingdonia uniflora]